MNHMFLMVWRLAQGEDGARKMWKEYFEDMYRYVYVAEIYVTKCQKKSGKGNLEKEFRNQKMRKAINQNKKYFFKFKHIIEEKN